MSFRPTTAIKTMQQKQERNHPTGDPQGEKQHSDAVTRVTGVVLAVWIFLILSGIFWAWLHSYITDPADFAKVYVQTIIALALAIVAVGQVGIYLRQADALDAQLKVSQQTFDMMQRPSLGLMGANIHTFEAGKKAIILVRYQNSGHMPARGTTIESGVGIFPFPPMGECPNANMSVRTTDINSRDSIPINGVRLCFASSDAPLTPKQVIDVKAGDHSLLVMGKVQYGSDGKTAPYFVHYYGRYNPDSKQIDICSTHNDAN